MPFNSSDFLLFFPIVVLIYFLIPTKLKKIWLLLASFFFYMCWNVKYIILIFTSIIITYFCAIILEKIKHTDRSELQKVKLMKLTMILSLAINLGLLVFFKYTNFFLSTIQSAFHLLNIELNIPTFDILLPVGISFYTFQAIGYTIDVYRNDIYAEKNFIQYALFVSFFPQLVAGPIERSKNLLVQLSTNKKFNYENFRQGFLYMLWGYFLKIVIADRAAIFVDTVYNNLDNYQGGYIFVASILFSIQIYCDFYGYSMIAKGAAKILGISLMENFEYPYLRQSISDFWHGWHISLSTWFRDYLYIPLGGNRKGAFRKYLNVMIVFLVSGLWHGASVSFVIWGGLHGIYQVIGDVIKPLRLKIRHTLQLDSNSFGYKLSAVAITFYLTNFAFIFFRGGTFSVSITAIKKMYTFYNPWILFDGSLYSCGLDRHNFILLLFCIGILLLADICKLKRIQISEIIIQQDILAKSLILSLILIFILLFGIWGTEYNASGFIYFQF